VHNKKPAWELPSWLFYVVKIYFDFKAIVELQTSKMFQNGQSHRLSLAYW